MTYYHPKYYKEMRRLRRAQASKLTSSRVGGPESRQAPSTNELDKDPGLGYYGNCVRGPDAELKQHQKRPATRSSGSSRRGLNSQTTSSQASGRKPSSPEPRGQASSPRNSVPGSGNQGTSESAQASLNRKQG